MVEKTEELFLFVQKEHGDEHLLIQLARHDKEAFGELYQRYVGRIYNYVYYRTGNVEEAQDLTARVFQRAMANIATYQEKGVPFVAWLFRIARNLVANWYRDQGRRPTVELDSISHWYASERDPETVMQLAQNQESLLAAVRRLPEDRQDLLIYKFLHRMSNAEIGEIMGRSEGAVKSLYHRTLLALREELEQQNQPITLPDELGQEEKSPPRGLRFWRRESK